MNFDYDAVVVGSGPNGLAAAITLAQAGCSVLVMEANHSLGGSARSAELTLPGFVHDTCSAVHPLAAGSPFFKTLPLQRFGLEWIQPEIPLAHPLDNGVACLRRDVQETADSLGENSYAAVMRPLVRDWDKLSREILQPMLHFPEHPIVLARFGLKAIRPATGFFRRESARALFAGMAAHSFLPLEATASAAFALVLGMAGHAVGWPIPHAGSQSIANVLANYLRELGGKIETEHRVENLAELPKARAVLFDTSAWEFARIAADQLPAGYRNKLERFRRGPGVFKIDYALSSPIPWRAPECRRAGTVHVGGTLEEIAASERAVANGEHPSRPFVLVAQQSLFDETRAPLGQHTLWAYCHVPNASSVDMSDRIEQQIERFAPGFRDCILARHSTNTPALEKSNANLSGGDINGGAANLAQLIARPVFGVKPYRTPLRGVYLCSASTPPGGGVHGMCGYHAARTALGDVFHRNF
ncbi:MAG: NAD(P)/FAD-dependent oxidoreductase [Verrucomicrobiota bacterium]|nr:NAD(P)/FAD-dependent oxidoreductase [Verrucomicrobiota bacterium]